MGSEQQVIAKIKEQMMVLVEDATTCPNLRRLGGLLADEFAWRKSRQGLEVDPEAVDINQSAKHVLTLQLRCLLQNGDCFSSVERHHLVTLFNLLGE